VEVAVRIAFVVTMPDPRRQRDPIHRRVAASFNQVLQGDGGIRLLFHITLFSRRA
jgi:hypothetical protein